MAEHIDLADAAELLKAFAHPTRLMILQELRQEPKCVSDMEELVPARQPNISQHLAVLRYMKLVDYAQAGGLRCYYLCRPKLVREVLAAAGRDEPVLKRTPSQIQAEKRRRAATEALPVNKRAAKRRPARARVRA
jgi:ArsR family transcriptional regulator